YDQRGIAPISSRTSTTRMMVPMVISILLGIGEASTAPRKPRPRMAGFFMRALPQITLSKWWVDICSITNARASGEALTMGTMDCVRSGTDGVHHPLHHDLAPVHRDESIGRPVRLKTRSFSRPDAPSAAPPRPPCGGAAEDTPTP